MISRGETHVEETDEKPVEETGPTPAQWEPDTGQPLEEESFYF